MSENLWDEVLARVESKINRHSFATWFRPTSFLSQDGDTLRIAVPNAQFREWLSKNYLGVLQEALAGAVKKVREAGFAWDDLACMELAAARASFLPEADRERARAAIVAWRLAQAAAGSGGNSSASTP